MENFDNDIQLNNFFEELKKEKGSIKPSTELLKKTLEKISVTNGSYNRIFSREVVNKKSISFNIMKNLKVLIPVGIVALLAIVLVAGKLNVSKSGIAGDTGMQGSTSNEVANQPAATPQSSIDDITNSVSYSGDASISNDNTDSTSVSNFDQEAANAATDQYETTN